MCISDWSSGVCSSDLGDVERLLAFVRDRQVGHRRRGTCQGLGASQAHGELGDLERIEEGESLTFAAFQVERESGAGAGAMAFVDIGLPVILQETEIADALDLGIDRKSTRLNSSH